MFGVFFWKFWDDDDTVGAFFVQNFPSIQKKPAGFFTASAGEDTVHYEFGRLNH